MGSAPIYRGWRVLVESASKSKRVRFRAIAVAAIEQAINDGEDYELLFAIASRDGNRLQASWKKRFPKLPLTRIGRLSRPSATRHRQFRGYVHFK